MQATLFHKSPDWQLDVGVGRAPRGDHVVFSNFEPGAWWLPYKGKFSLPSSTDELRWLRDAIDQSLDS